MGRIVNMEGQLMAPETAVISVFDRGFLYGDSVYEVLRTYHGALFELDAHLERLANSAALIALDLPWSLAKIATEAERTVQAARNAESYLRVVVTRGTGPMGLDPVSAHDAKVIFIAQELTTPPASAYQQGVMVLLVDARHQPHQAPDPAAKTGNHLNNVLAMKQAKQRGAFEALMLDHAGMITEASSANIFVVRDGQLLTPPLGAGILEGVTRRVVLQVARAQAMTVREVELRPDDLLAADEAFLTSTTRELVPVVRVARDEKEHLIGTGVPGPVTLRLLADFRARAQKSRNAH